MDINEIKEFLESNKDSEEVKGLIKSFQQPLTRDVVEEWCKEGEGKSWLDRNCDLYSNKAVETARNNAIEKFKKEELPKIIEGEFKKKSNEGLSETEIALKETQKQLEEMKNELKVKDLKANYSKVLNEKNLDLSLLDYLPLNADEEGINKAIETFSNIINNGIKIGIDNKLTSNPAVPQESEGNEGLTGVEKAFFERTGVKL